MNNKLSDFMMNHHEFLLQKSQGLIIARTNVIPVQVGGGCAAQMDKSGKTKCCGRCKTQTVFVEGEANRDEAIALYRAGKMSEAENFVKWKCDDESKNTIVSFVLNNIPLLQNAMNIVAYDYLKTSEQKKFEDEIERIVISKRQKEISSKRKKHPFYDESIRKAALTWKHFPTVSYARMAKALDSFFGDGVSREAIEGWLKDVKLRPEGPVRKTSFTLMG